MADAISIQELIDARTDAKTLEQAVNGDAVTTVLSRLGETYPTLSNALNQIDSKLDSADTQIKQGITNLFENGGLPATPFATKALMTASALVDGKYAMVTNDTTNNGLYVKAAGAWVKSAYDPTALANTYTDNKVKGVTNNFKTKALVVASALPDGSYAMVTEDTEANNGLYVKTAGAWVKSAYDPIEQANTYTDTSSASVKQDFERVISTNTDNSGDLLQFKDANGDDYARFDKDGYLYLVNMNNNNLQTELEKLPEHDDKNGDLINILDAEGNLIIRQDADGYLYLPNMKDSIQVAIANRATGEGEFVNSDKIYDRLHFSDEVMPYINHLLVSQNTFAAPFYGSLPTNYTVDDSIISNFRADVSPNHIPINTVYRVDDDVIHPCVVEAVGTIRGYKYIMGITGYLNVREENPMVFGSNDLESFELLTGFVQPLGLPEATGYLSDVCLGYDPTTGDFICFWRCTVELAGSSTESSLRYRRTKDLTNWGDEVEFFPPLASNIDDLISPSIVFHPSEKRWYMWTVSGHSGEMRLRKSDTLDGLAAVPYERILNAGAAMPWHIEVKWVGNKFMMLLFNDTANNLFLGISDDGASWIFSQTPIFTTNPLEFYKSSFVPSFNDNGDLELDILYSQGRKVHHSKTNALNINGV